mmetsp:Transcript_16157/g.24609  ORF Transcript_16157/g.24609 Transcript_16157/m.24609 type:complete len:215 (+) Transcript_16157:67-711(+)
MAGFLDGPKLNGKEQPGNQSCYTFPFKGISVWLEIDSVSTKYAVASVRERINIPGFQPHVTVLYGIEDMRPADVDAELRTIAQNVPPFELNVAINRFAGGYKFGDFRPFDMRYFQIEYEEHTGVLDQLHSNAAMVLGGGVATSPAGFLPHASLIYANLGDPRFNAKDAANLVHQYPGLLTEKVLVSAMSVVSTHGTPDQWEVLSRVPLIGKKEN